MDNPISIADVIEIDLATPHWDNWDVVDVDTSEGVLHVTAENDMGDVVTFDLTVSNVTSVAGPPSKEDFEPDRRE